MGLLFFREVDYPRANRGLRPVSEGVGVKLCKRAPRTHLQPTQDIRIQQFFRRGGVASYECFSNTGGGDFVLKRFPDDKTIGVWFVFIYCSFKLCIRACTPDCYVTIPIPCRFPSEDVVGCSLPIQRCRFCAHNKITFANHFLFLHTSSAPLTL